MLYLQFETQIRVTENAQNPHSQAGICAFFVQALDNQNRF